MARVYQYVRPVNAVLTDVTLGTTMNRSENGIRIKEEPLDLDTDNFNGFPTNEDTSNRKRSTESGDRVTSHEYNSKENSLNLVKNKRKRPSGESKKSQDYPKVRKKKVTDVPQVESQNDSNEFQQLKTTLPLSLYASQRVRKRKDLNEFYCNICWIHKKTKVQIDRHIKRYSKVHKCDVCNQVFCIWSSLRRHQMMHLSGETLSQRCRLHCHFCKRSFSDKIGLQMHLFHCHKDQMKQNLFSMEITNPVTNSVDRIEESIPMENSTANEITMNEIVVKREVEDVDETVSIEDIDYTAPNGYRMEQQPSISDTTDYPTNIVTKVEQNVSITDNIYDILEDAMSCVTEDVKIGEVETRSDTTISVGDAISNLEQGLASNDMDYLTNVEQEKPANSVASDMTENIAWQEEPINDAINSASNLIKQEEPVNDATNTATDVPEQESPTDYAANDATDVVKQEEPINNVTNAVTDVAEQEEPTNSAINGSPDVAEQEESANSVISNPPIVAEQEELASTPINDIREEIVEQNPPITDTESRVATDIDKTSQKEQDKVTANQDKPNKTLRRSIRILKSKNKEETAETPGSTSPSVFTRHCRSCDAALTALPVSTEPRRSRISSPLTSLLKTRSKFRNRTPSKTSTSLRRSGSKKSAPNSPATSDGQLELVNAISTRSPRSIGHYEPRSGSPKKLETQLSPKKMRQTTLTEFLSLSGKSPMKKDLKKEINNDTEEGVHATSAKAVEWLHEPSATSTLEVAKVPAALFKEKTVDPSISKIPFVRLHVSPDTAFTLLNNDIKTEPEDLDSSTVSPSTSHQSREVTLRRRSSSRRSLTESQDKNPNSKRELPSRSSTGRRISSRTYEDRMRAKYNLKECMVKLNRYEALAKATSNRMNQTECIIPLQLRAQRTIVSGKESLIKTPKIRIVELDNCIVFEVVDPR